MYTPDTESGSFLTRLQAARALAALPAAGAWDTAPSELVCAGADSVSLFVKYTRGAVGGAVGIKIETSPYTDDDDEWYQVIASTSGSLVVGTDTLIDTQQGYYQYTADSGAEQGFVIGLVDLAQTVDRIRVSCAETGTVGSPGTCSVVARFV